MSGGPSPSRGKQGGRGRPAHSFGAPLGRVTHAVLHHAHCPVAVVPRG
ncbi:universal stress protein [Actinacidiphila cocklensis]|nr:universal stress protein [Actinacidiphila cocklensis]WSX75077.1 universal stress protein [Streptomyces sp. NBC_00899]